MFLCVHTHRRGAGRAGRTASGRGRCTCCSSSRSREPAGPESAHQPAASSRSRRSSSPERSHGHNPHCVSKMLIWHPLSVFFLTHLNIYCDSRSETVCIKPYCFKAVSVSSYFLFYFVDYTCVCHLLLSSSCPLLFSCSPAWCSLHICLRSPCQLCPVSSAFPLLPCSLVSCNPLINLWFVTWMSSFFYEELSFVCECASHTFIRQPVKLVSPSRL